MRQLYNLIIYLVESLVWLPALFNAKLQLGVGGRRRTFDVLQSNISEEDKVIWMHVASLGEFEQGRPVLEQIKIDYPSYKVLLTFFSPSGYELRKDFSFVDVVCYLPLDTTSNARRFLNYAHPDLVIFVKYEFWPNFLSAIKSKRIKAILISTVVQNDNALLKYNPSWFRDLMNTFNYILTQDQDSLNILSSLNLDSNIQIAGDTRIDRTISIASESIGLLDVEKFCGDNPVFIAGSTWPPDEEIIAAMTHSAIFAKWKLIIAPHDIGESHIKNIEKSFTGSIRYSQINQLNNTHRVLIIDNIGLLNKLYRYGRIAYIGGGFGAGIHNTLEPAAFGLPIIFGPKHEKFIEARILIDTQGAFVVQGSGNLIDVCSNLQNDKKYNSAVNAVNQFMASNKGATKKVMQVIDLQLA